MNFVNSSKRTQNFNYPRDKLWHRGIFFEFLAKKKTSKWTGPKVSFIDNVLESRSRIGTRVGLSKKETGLLVKMGMNWSNQRDV